MLCLSLTACAPVPSEPTFGAEVIHKPVLRPHGRHLPGQLLVRFDPARSRQQVDKIVVDMGGRILQDYPSDAGLYHLALPDGMTVAEGVDFFSGLPGVDYAEPVLLRRPGGPKP